MADEHSTCKGIEQPAHLSNMKINFGTDPECATESHIVSRSKPKFCSLREKQKDQKHWNKCAKSNFIKTFKTSPYYR